MTFRPNSSRTLRRLFVLGAVAGGVWVALLFPRRKLAQVGRAPLERQTSFSEEKNRSHGMQRVAEPSALASAPVEAEHRVQLEKMAAADPAAAVADALRETDSEIRQRSLLAILRAWAAVEPDDAARAALAWPGSDRSEPIAAVLAGVARRPRDALRLGAFFCREDPSWAPEHGRALIAALSEEGHFAAAVSFAVAGEPDVGDEERSKWIKAAFAGWAEQEPRLAALAATSDLPESGLQEEALLAVVARWRRATPGGPEKFLAQLPFGSERSAFRAALAATASQ